MSQPEETLLDVRVSEDGLVHIIADPITACRLTGRSIYGKQGETRERLEEAIAVSWYRADCPVWREA